jgi:environmental stress-induced protein Ves
MIRIIRASEMREGRWLNGMGVSWDIAADPPGAAAADFGWRFAIARIDADVPFSHYENVDRIFTLIEGRGLVLSVAGMADIDVREAFVPHRFPGDVATACHLKDGPCRALNLFLARGKWIADVRIIRAAAGMTHDGPVLLYALEGTAICDGAEVVQGDAAVASGALQIEAVQGALYCAALTAT